MYVERLVVSNFRHIRNAEFGPFREPPDLGELIVLAGPNGGGKSSVLELLSYGLTSRYSWQYYQSRKITEHSFAIRIGLTPQEVEELCEEDSKPEVCDYAKKERGYWMQVNMPDIIDPSLQTTNERVHGLVSRRFQSFTRKLGFFIRSDRGYGAREYDRRHLFNWRRRLEPNYFNSISYNQTTQQYTDMYDFLVEQSYHYVYQLGLHHKNLDQGVVSQKPVDPLTAYNDLLGRLFPGYSFVEASGEDLSLRVRLPTGDMIPFQDMSSGEKEVFFILSFFIRHSISNSIIVIDEPELHLHPELARKLIKLMRGIKPKNQLWCATHSAELVDESGRERTFFLRASDDRTRMECIPATAEGAELQLLRDMFGYSGYIGVSRKIVFSEGTESSADRKTFANLFRELSEGVRIIPVGSVNNLYGINRAILALLEADVARCEFYLIRDRDYLSDDRIAKHRSSAPGRMFVLSRYHIENYLLDEELIADVLRRIFQRIASPQDVRRHLLSIARERSAVYLRDLVACRFGELYQSEDLSVGNHSANLAAVDARGELRAEVLDPLKNALTTRYREVNAEVSQRISEGKAETIFETCVAMVKSALQESSEEWKSLFPGRDILRTYSLQNGLGNWPALQNILLDRLAQGEHALVPELREIIRAIERGRDDPTTPST